MFMTLLEDMNIYVHENLQQRNDLPELIFKGEHCPPPNTPALKPLSLFQYFSACKLYDG